MVTDAKANAAILAILNAISEAKTLQGFVLIPATDVLKWTLQHGAAINAAMNAPDQTQERGG